MYEYLGQQSSQLQASLASVFVVAHISRDESSPIDSCDFLWDMASRLFTLDSVQFNSGVISFLMYVRYELS